MCQWLSDLDDLCVTHTVEFSPIGFPGAHPIPRIIASPKTSIGTFSYASWDASSGLSGWITVTRSDERSAFMFGWLWRVMGTDVGMGMSVGSSLLVTI